MWIIIEKTKETPSIQCWISGVFINHENAVEYLAMIPDRPNEVKELREIEAQDYPVLFFYDFFLHDIIYVTLEELTDKLLSFRKVEDDDHQYCIYYTFQKDYRGFSSEEEYYPLVDHHHVDNHKMMRLIRKGLSVDSVGNHGNIAGIYWCSNCSRLASGILSEKGYEPPLKWLIMPQFDPENKVKYMTVCSENCKLILTKEWEELSNECL